MREWLKQAERGPPSPRDPNGGTEHNPDLAYEHADSAVRQPAEFLRGVLLAALSINTGDIANQWVEAELIKQHIYEERVRAIKAHLGDNPRV